MKYKVYRLTFNAGVHFGKGRLEDTDYTFCADTLFSSMCIEAVRDSEDRLNKLVANVKNGNLIISDGLPYIDDSYYIPKPMCDIKNKDDETAGNSVIKKLYKNTKFIPADMLQEYINGEFSSDIAEEFSTFGKKYIKVSASINGNDETVPYRVGQFFYNENNGLYVIAGYKNDDVLVEFEQLLKLVGLSGIGGERSSGMGRFTFEKVLEEDYQYSLQELMTMLNVKADTYMTLSLSLPKENELENVLESARYKIIKRSGFVASSKFPDKRKKDLYVLSAGACVASKYEGDVYDVSSDNNYHAVYRYAKPMFMGVIS